MSGFVPDIPVVTTLLHDSGETSYLVLRLIAPADAFIKFRENFRAISLNSGHVVDDATAERYNVTGWPLKTDVKDRGLPVALLVAIMEIDKMFGEGRARLWVSEEAQGQAEAVNAARYTGIGSGYEKAGGHTSMFEGAEAQDQSGVKKMEELAPVILTGRAGALCTIPCYDIPELRARNEDEHVHLTRLDLGSLEQLAGRLLSPPAPRPTKM